MRIHKQIRLSLELTGKDGKLREIYPLIMQNVLRSCRSFKAADPGTATFEDFLSSAVVRVMRAHARYDQTTTLATFMIPHINGAYLDLMRSEMNYVKRYHPWGNEHTQRQDPKGGGIPEFEAGHDFTILQKQLYAALPHLTALQRAVIYGRYFKDLPMGKISDKLFIKREEADEAHTRALEILRRKIKR